MSSNSRMKGGAELESMLAQEKQTLHKQFRMILSSKVRSFFFFLSCALVHKQKLLFLFCLQCFV